MVLLENQEKDQTSFSLQELLFSASAKNRDLNLLTFNTA